MARLKRKLLFGSLFALGGTAALAGALAATSVGGGGSSTSGLIAPLRADSATSPADYDETFDFVQGGTSYVFDYPPPANPPPDGYKTWTSPSAKVIAAPTGDNRNDDYRLGADPWTAPFGAVLSPSGTQAVVTWTASPSEGAGSILKRTILIRFSYWRFALGGGVFVRTFQGGTDVHALAGAGMDELLSIKFVSFTYPVFSQMAAARLGSSRFRFTIYALLNGVSGETGFLSDQELRRPDRHAGTSIKHLNITFYPSTGTDQEGNEPSLGPGYFIFVF